MRFLLALTCLLLLSAALACTGDDGRISGSGESSPVSVPGLGGGQGNSHVQPDNDDATPAPPREITVTITDDSLRIDPEAVKATTVEFVVRNEGTELHNFVLLLTAAKAEGLPMATNDTVDERSMMVTRLASTDPVEPGTEARVRADLQPSFYVAISNMPGDYAAGIRAPMSAASSNQPELKDDPMLTPQPRP